jgi:hypothetical protein
MSVKLRGVGTPDDCQDFRHPELLTLVETPDKPNREHQEGYYGWANTGHVWYHLVLPGTANTS